MSWINANDEQNLLYDVSQRVKSRQRINPRDQLVSEKLGSIYRRHPYIQPGVALSLAESLADDGTVDAVAQQSAFTQYNKNNKAAEDTQQPDFGPYGPGTKAGKIEDNIVNAGMKVLKWLGGNTIGRSSKIKTASRWATSLGSFGPEYLANYFSRVFDPERGTNDTEGIIASTSLGTLMQHGNEAGDGFFLGGAAEEKRVEKVRRYRWKINGESYTIGRGTANIIFQPGSEPYKFLSGAIDAAVNWQFDLTNKPIDEIAKSIKAGQLIPAVGTRAEVDAAAALVRDGAGVSAWHQGTIDHSKFFNWLDNTRVGRRLVRNTAAETNEYRLWERYNGKLRPEEARRLAQETDPDKIRGILAENAIRLSQEVEQGFVPFPTTARGLPMASAVGQYVEQMPGYLTIKNSRWFAKMPKSVLLTGTPEDKANTIDAIGNWLKTNGIDPYTGDGARIMRRAFDFAGANGTKNDADQIVRLMVGNSSKPGILQKAMKANGHTDEVIDDVFRQYSDAVAQMRTYAYDQHGRVNDNGFFRHMTQYMTDNELKAVLDDLYPGKIPAKATRAELDQFLLDLPPGTISVNGPMSFSEMFNNAIILPDVRQVRGLTNPFFGKYNPFKPMRYDKTKVAAAIDAVDWFQNEVWRPYALMTVGFIMRNTFDSQLRMGMNGLGLSTPWDYFAMAVKKEGDYVRGVGNIQGVRWVDAGDDLAPIGTSLDDFARTSGYQSRWYVDDPAEELSRFVLDGQVNVSNISEGATYTNGFASQAAMIFGDAFQNLMVRLHDIPVDMQAAAAKRLLDAPENAALRNSLVQMLSYGNTVVDVNNGAVKSIMRVSNAANMTTDELVAAFYEQAQRATVDNFIMGSDEIRVLAGYNDVPISPGALIDEQTAKSLHTIYPLRKPIKRGDLLINASDPDNIRQFRVLEETSQVYNGKTVRNYKVVEVVEPGQAITKQGTPSEAARKFIDDRRRLHQESVTAGGDPMMPTWTKHRIAVDKEKVMTALGKRYESLGGNIKAPPNWFFRGPVASWTKMAERSPSFRMMYYNHVVDNAVHLRPDQAQKLLDDLDEFASIALPQTYAVSPDDAIARYIGGKDRYKKLMAAINEAKRTKQGIGTIEQLDRYAGAVSRIEAEEMFFSNFERSNFTDANRILSPFAAAWAEVFGKYGQEMLYNPSRLRKATLTYEAVTNRRGGQEGKGFVYRDPTTGQLMFQFPFYGTAMKAITSGDIPIIGDVPFFGDLSRTVLDPLSGGPGVEGFFKAPVKQVSAGMSFVPSAGPVMQIALSKLFNAADLPNEQMLRKALLPYGESNFDALIPGVWKKALSALGPGRDLTDGSTLSNAIQDVFRYYASTGEYDLSDSNDVDRLVEDSKHAGRGVALLRAISQFIGPTAGRPEFVYTKKDRENPKLKDTFYVGELQKALSDLQAADYETAIPKFIEAFGQDALPYLAAKTRTNPLYGGIEPTAEFEQWRQENRGLVQAFKTTAPYLAPIGERGFDINAWGAQIGEGLKYRTDPRDGLKQAQYRIASALYREFRKQPKYQGALTDEQEKELRAERQRLHEKYPGFPPKPIFESGRFDQFIGELKNLVKDKRAQGNKTTDAISNYLNFRDNMIRDLDRIAGVSLKAAKNSTASEARAKLNDRGELLATLVPDFRRIWDEELSQEVDTASE